MSIVFTLQHIVALVGKLDDTSGQETPRERFRQFLPQMFINVGQVRDYIEEYLRAATLVCYVDALISDCYRSD